MVKTQTILVNPSVLEWARKSAGLGIPQAASMLGVTTGFIIDIESNHRKPSKTLLRKMSQVYKRSFPVLLLPEPPIEDDIPTDYRTLPVRKRLIGPDTAQALREARRLQEAISDFIYDDLETFPILEPLSISVEDKPNTVGEQIRRLLEVDIHEQKKWSNPSYAFRQWRGKFQSKGVFVIVEDFPREEARGFSLWKPDMIPMIVVSENETAAAQIFTLFHEFVHILLRSDAMCLKQESQTFQGNVEAWCNKVAAATLVPENDIRNFIGINTYKEWSLEELQNIASKYKVSRHVIAIRLEQLQHAPNGYYNQIKDALEPDDYIFIKKPKPQKDKDFKRDIPKQRLAEVGFATTNLILKACQNSIISTIEAADLLRVRPDKFSRLQELTTAQAERYG